MRKLAVSCGGLVLGLLVATAIFSLPGAGQNVAIYAYSDQVLLNFDPADIWSVNIVWFNVYERLLRYYPEEDRFEPELATSYEKSADGLEWTFYIRQGVKFHTGNPLTAEAVKDCIERTIARGKGVSYIWEPVDRIDVVDDYAVKFYLRTPAPLDLIVSSLAGALIYDPTFDHSWYEAGNDSGTGPYRFAEHKGLEEAVITKFDEYWRGWTGNEFEAIIFKTVPEDSTRLMMLETGEADLTNRLAFEMLETVQSNPNLEVFRAPVWQQIRFFLNTLKPPLDNVLVRKALAYSLPYKDIIKAALYGFGERSHGLVPKSLWGSSENVRIYDFNLTVAKALLTEAGYPNGGLRLLVTYNLGDEQERRACELWKEQLALLNIDLDIQAMPWNAQIGLAHDPNPLERQDIFCMYSWPLAPEPVSFLKRHIGTADPPLSNVSYYSNPVVDHLLTYANDIAGIDRAGAAAIVEEIQHIVMDDIPVIPVADLQAAIVKQTSLKGPDWAFSNPAYPRVVDWYNLHRE